MGPYTRQINVLCKRLAWVFVLYSVCRILFYLLNRSYFQNLGFGEFLSICFYGLRFDAFSILAINSAYILFLSLPFRFVYSNIYQGIWKWWFIITNAIGLLLNFVDFAYFPYTQKRTTYDVFNMAFGGQSEMDKLVPLFLRDFWYVVIIYIICVWGLVNRYNRIQLYYEEPFNYKIKNTLKYLVTFLIVAGLTTLGIRGGMQRVPIGIVDGAKFASPQFIPILFNTPFSIIKSAELKTIEELSLMPETEAIKYINPVHPADTGTFKQKNICVIILESFSKEYTGIGNRRSYTPFLDSLMKQSMVFTNAYSNGKKSIEGIPSILASMPSLMEDPYLNSYYSNNAIQALPNLLKQKGYYSAFFHGGTNGTMNFDAFAKIAGFDAYYGRSEYGNDADYDGQWGIWDEPFLQYTAKKIGEFKEPFMVSFFTLSSHHPYQVPKQYAGRFPKGTLEVHESIGYADFALRRFFEAAQKTSWFKNTLFVISPDHTGISEDPYYANPKGQYSIPIVLYDPSDALKGTAGQCVQQIDIMPGILDYLNYDRPYFSFGKSLFDTKHPCIYYNNGNFYVVHDSLFYSINSFKADYVVNYYRDSLIQNTIKGKNPVEDFYTEQYTKAFVQTYNNAIIRNKTLP
ncbi:MAG: sulfatase-like hydrolase/transferase [Bacteroidetes bacterium]|nr:sulfatase-like hydrolase/transferase [Bacteroidota bacterium]